MSKINGQHLNNTLSIKTWGWQSDCRQKKLEILWLLEMMPK
jgi:hypothetical protein